jgi:hypothetical protein
MRGFWLLPLRCVRCVSEDFFDDHTTVPGCFRTQKSMRRDNIERLVLVRHVFRASCVRHVDIKYVAVYTGGLNPVATLLIGWFRPSIFPSIFPSIHLSVCFMVCTSHQQSTGTCRNLLTAQPVSLVCTPFRLKKPPVLNSAGTLFIRVQ